MIERELREFSKERQFYEVGSISLSLFFPKAFDIRSSKIMQRSSLKMHQEKKQIQMLKKESEIILK